MGAVRLLTVCGSLQRRSANRAALDVVAGAARRADRDDFDRLGQIPPFDPDRVDEAIDAVDDWRARVEAADGVVIAAPEYAGGLAGTLKNALDWLVGHGSLYRTPVAIISAGTSGGVHARTMLARTLTWQGAYVVAEVGIAAPRPKSDADGRLVDPATVGALEDLAATLLDATQGAPAELARLAARVLAPLGVDGANLPTV